MKKIEEAVREYIEKKLVNVNALRNCISFGSVLLTENEDDIVWDIMVLLPDDIFSQRFVPMWGNCFVVDDHDHTPWVFTRVKSYEWLKKDFSRRLAVSLWIFKNAFVFQDNESKFSQMLKEQESRFEDELDDLIKMKYIEFRSERHNLRHALQKKRMVAVSIIKATIAKLVFEICFLIDSKPYPYKKLLPSQAVIETENGERIMGIISNFLKSEGDELINLSEKIVQEIAIILRNKNPSFGDFVEKWWLHLE